MDQSTGHAILDAQTVEECIIEQRWGDYTPADHNTWKTLYERQLQVLRGHVCDEYLEGLKTLHLEAEAVPDFERMNRHLRAATGWEVLPVPGLIASRPFFTMLSNRQFPAGTFIRTPEQLDYLEEPDIFHDVFGHVPLLSNSSYASYMQEYGRAGLAALEQKGIKFLARLNWHTIEFGLVGESRNIKIYGAGIISSFGETKYVIDNPSANFIQFNLERVLRTGYYIDDFQANYFVISSFDALFEEMAKSSLASLYQDYRAKPTLSPFTLLESDVILRRGTNEYTKDFAATKVKLK